MKKKRVMIAKRFLGNFTTIFLILFIFSCFDSIDAQFYAPQIKKSEFLIGENKEGLSEAWKAIKKGDKYFDEGDGYLKLAREHYLKAYNYNKTNAALNYKIGICYLFVDNQSEALKYLRKAYEFDPEITRDIHFMMGRAHHLMMQFDRAIDEYETYRKNLTDKEKKKGWFIDVEKYIDECMNGKELMKEPSRVIINQVGKEINSGADEYNFVISPGDTSAFFTSRRPLYKKSDIARWDNKYFENILVSKKNGKKWGPASSVGKKINKNDRHNAIIAVSDDMKKMYIYDGRKGRGDILVSEFKKDKWRKPKTFIKKINTKYQETSMCFTPTRDTVYYISSKEDSYGGKDIYFTYLDGKPGKKQKWQDPINVGPTVNSPYDEESVFIDETGNTMYFSSKGHKSMGGYDVYKSIKEENGDWGKPVNLGYPVNKAGDELFYKTTGSEKFAYYSALRDEGIGEKDVYKIIYLGEEKELLLSYEDILVAGNQDSVYHIFFRDPELIEIDTRLTLKGIITDKKTGEPVKAKMELIDPDNSDVAATAISGEDGTYKIKLEEKKNYGVEIVARDYMLYIDVVDLMSEPSNELIVRDFQLEKVEVGTKIVLENIYFEFAKSTLKPESYDELNNLVKLLRENEKMRIEISGHTDNVGSFKYNQKLSEGRAKSVVEYLISQGIDKDRLEYAGYAYSQPIASNDTEEGRAKNRRVEFKILSKE